LRGPVAWRRRVRREGACQAKARAVPASVPRGGLSARLPDPGGPEEAP